MTIDSSRRGFVAKGGKGPEGGREEYEEARMELTFLSSDGRIRQGMYVCVIYDGRER